tara:strand:+ start:557 stop:1669 length:1113 start_codon:yes stop_codon:yes gene_type:complete
MNTQMPHSTWVEIELEAIKDNVRYFSDNSDANLMVIVKANAYGHGALPVLETALRAGAGWCGVARADEALELRRAGIQCPILVLGFTPLSVIEELIVNNISMAAWDIEHLKDVDVIAQKIDMPARIHLKVDTGMGRIGVYYRDALDVARYLNGTQSLLFEGISTHYARAHEADIAPTMEQNNRFCNVVGLLRQAGICPSLVHSENSAAIINRLDPKWNMIRLGIAMYGLDPSEDCQCPDDLRPALTWKTQLSQVKHVPKGIGISYGHKYITSGPEIIGTVPTGYADGYRPYGEKTVLVRGKRVSVVGAVCMDQFMVRLDSVPGAAVGDEVVIIGCQGMDRISAEEVALGWNTINYDVVSSIGSRVPRVYV